MQTSGGLENSTLEVLFSDDQLSENGAFEPAVCEKADIWTSRNQQFRGAKTNPRIRLR